MLIQSLLNTLKRPALRPGVLSLMALALFLFLLPTIGLAELSPSTYRQADWEACKKELEAGSTKAEHLLVQGMRVRDPGATLNFMRTILALPDAPQWVHSEALQILCEAFCASEEEDSLRQRQQELSRLTGRTFDCPLFSVPTDSWMIQIGAFSSLKNAQKALQPFQKGSLTCKIQQDGPHYRALLGAFPTKKNAREEARRLKRNGAITDFRLLEVSP
jgi:hypothetical protein